HLQRRASDGERRGADLPGARRRLLLGLADGGLPDRQPAGGGAVQPLPGPLHRRLHGGGGQVMSPPPPQPARSAPALPLLIGGTWRVSASERSAPVLDPASGSELARVPYVTAAEI